MEYLRPLSMTQVQFIDAWYQMESPAMNHFYLWVGLTPFNAWIIMAFQKGLVNMTMIYIIGLVCEA